MRRLSLVMGYRQRNLFRLAAIVVMCAMPVSLALAENEPSVMPSQSTGGERATGAPAAPSADTEGSRRRNAPITETQDVKATEGEHTKESTKVSEFALAVFTAVLAVATIYLWLATRSLANNTKEDFDRRKIHDTVSAWSEIRNMVPIGGFPTLNAQSKLDSDQRDALRRMEYFAACINSEVYDLKIFVRISGSWFLGEYKKLKDYVETRSNSLAYDDLRKLQSKVSDKRPERKHE